MLLRRLQNTDKNICKLFQFLMGLNGSYEHVVNQNLLMKNLPSICRAYSMIAKVEKQREVLNDNSVEIAYYSRMKQGKTYNYVPDHYSYKNFQKNPSEDRPCSHCSNPYHSKKICFKLIGYTEWCMELKKKKKPNKNIIWDRFDFSIKTQVWLVPFQYIAHLRVFLLYILSIKHFDW